ncbi:MAG: NAD(P)/FAD-dependent oxidoreductase [Planctomycetota bacterium]
MSTERTKALIIGAGLSGLACALRLSEEGHECILLEASDGVGGRVRTDTITRPEGNYLLDRGFQVYLDAYPEGRRFLDHEALDLSRFYPGAMVRFGDDFHRVADPFRRPLHAAAAVRSPIATLPDLVKIGGLYRAIRKLDPNDPDIADRPAIELLRHFGLSDQVIDCFFRPFFGGVFFDRSLETSSRALAFNFLMFARGNTTLPADGMQAIPDQLAAKLPEETVRLRTRALSIDGTRVQAMSGGVFEADHVVIATDGAVAHDLMNQPRTRAFTETTCVWFASPHDPVDQPILLLDGDGKGPVNHLAVVSSVQPTYAPKSHSLISASIIGGSTHSDGHLADLVRSQLVDWFPDHDLSKWDLLRINRIRHALPAQPAGSLSPWQRSTTIAPNLHVCGDHVDNASINGALASGRRCAEAILES